MPDIRTIFKNRYKYKKSLKEYSYGNVPGISVGQILETRKECSDRGLHGPTQAGIHGNSVHGVYSVVLSGGYEDDFDQGEKFWYTGEGGRKSSGGPQVEDQDWKNKNNRSLKISGKHPIRVIRGHTLDSPYAPSHGYRYDGLYRVVKAARVRGKSGFLLCRFLFVREKGQLPLEHRHHRSSFNSRADKMEQSSVTTSRRARSVSVDSQSTHVETTNAPSASTSKIQEHEDISEIEDDDDDDNSQMGLFGTDDDDASEMELFGAESGNDHDDDIELEPKQDHEVSENERASPPNDQHSLSSTVLGKRRRIQSPSSDEDVLPSNSRVRRKQRITISSSNSVPAEDADSEDDVVFLYSRNVKGKTQSLPASSREPSPAGGVAHADSHRSPSLKEVSVPRTKAVEKQTDVFTASNALQSVPVSSQEPSTGRVMHADSHRSPSLEEVSVPQTKAVEKQTDVFTVSNALQSVLVSSQEPSTGRVTHADSHRSPSLEEVSVPQTKAVEKQTNVFTASNALQSLSPSSREPSAGRVARADSHRSPSLEEVSVPRTKAVEKQTDVFTASNAFPSSSETQQVPFSAVPETSPSSASSISRALPNVTTSETHSSSHSMPPTSLTTPVSLTSVQSKLPTPTSADVELAVTPSPSQSSPQAAGASVVPPSAVLFPKPPPQVADVSPGLPASAGARHAISVPTYVAPVEPAQEPSLQVAGVPSEPPVSDSARLTLVAPASQAPLESMLKPSLQAADTSLPPALPASASTRQASSASSVASSVELALPEPPTLASDMPSTPPMRPTPISSLQVTGVSSEPSASTSSGLPIIPTSLQSQHSAQNNPEHRTIILSTVPATHVPLAVSQPQPQVQVQKFNWDRMFVDLHWINVAEARGFL